MKRRRKMLPYYHHTIEKRMKLCLSEKSIVNCTMGGWISSLWSLWYGEQELKLVIVGLNNAGKTTILYKLCVAICNAGVSLLDEVVATTPTIGSNVEEIQYKNLKFYCWDVGGQHTLRATWSNYFEYSNAVIFVVDSTDEKRLVVAKEELAKIVENPVRHLDVSVHPSTGLRIDRLLKNTLLLVLANKMDIPGSLPSSAISEALGLSSVTTHQWHIQSCCALNGAGLNDGMDWIVQRIESGCT